jgi:hypothetical protein
MRTLYVLALVLVLALVALAPAFVPSCVAPWVETPPDWKRQREETRKAARESVERLEKQYGDKPFGQWDERHKQIYTNAERILAEMGGKP